MEVGRDRERHNRPAQEQDSDQDDDRDDGHSAFGPKPS
jgi:hypothetical protein